LRNNRSPQKNTYNIIKFITLAFRSSIRDRKARLAFIISGLLYSLAYMFSTGMLLKANLSTNEPIIVKIVKQLNVTGFPSFMIIIGGKIIISINLLAATFLLLLSTLFASNIAILVYAYQSSKITLKTGRGVIAASTPAMFTSFACAAGCGSGLSATLVSLVPSMAGASAADVLAPIFAKWSWVFSVISAMLLLWSLYRMSKVAAMLRSGFLRLDLPRRVV
jgi:hypothetical protein